MVVSDEGNNAPNLPTNIEDFGGFDSSIILVLRGGLLMSTGFPGKFESSNLSRDNVSREIGRMVHMMNLLGWLRLGWLEILLITC